MISNLSKTYRPKAGRVFITILLSAVFFLCGGFLVKLSFDFEFDKTLFFLGCMAVVAGTALLIAVFSTHHTITIYPNGICFGRQKYDWDSLSLPGMQRDETLYPDIYAEKIETSIKDVLEIKAEKHGNGKSFKIFRKAYVRYDEIASSILTMLPQNKQNLPKSVNALNEGLFFEKYLRDVIA